MDDDRIEHALRLGPPDEPTYQPRGAWESGPEAVDRPADPVTAAPATRVGNDARAPGIERLRPIGVHVRGARQPSRSAFPMTIAASIAVLIGLLLLAQAVPLGPAASPAPTPDLLGRLSAAGSVEVAVSNEAPQTISQGGAYIGFDVDVAKAIARQLGLRAIVTPMPPDRFVSSPWQLALPGHAATTLGGSQASEPYAWWPVWLAVPADSAVTELGALASARVCVVSGTAGADWLAGGAAGATVTPPPAAAPVVMGSDEACIGALRDGRADALLSSTLFSDELQAQGLRLVGATPVVSDPWTVVVRGSASDSASLLAAVDEAIVQLRTTGRLAELSASSFGGRDVTVAVP
jgi:ABC-type amino acid transport substrate-binding protein